MFSIIQICTVCIKIIFLTSSDKAAFMMDCERNYSMWTFSGGFRTWVKMSLVKTSGRGNESVEFRQEVKDVLRQLQHGNIIIRVITTMEKQVMMFFINIQISGPPN